METGYENEELRQESGADVGKLPGKFAGLRGISLIFVIFDILAVNAAFFAALFLRFDLKFDSIPAEYLNRFMSFAPIYTAVCVIVLWFFRLYRSIWRYANTEEILRALGATIVTTAFHYFGIQYLYGRMPAPYFIFGGILQFLLLVFIRFGYHFMLILRERNRLAAVAADEPKSRVMLIGAGDAGSLILHDLRSSDRVRDNIVCVIDDDRVKWGRYLEGVPVVGGRESILAAAKVYKVDKIYLAVPSATPKQKREILAICNETGLEVKQLPGMYQIVSGRVSVTQLRDVNIEDLLGRDPIELNMDDVAEFIRGKTVMVTGGGGSIGSELCRQIAKHDPALLIIFDIYENSAYDIQLELKRTYPDLKLFVAIGSVRDSRRLEQIFDQYKPEVVYHAAAHKHVPLMEDSPGEAVKNNTVGTYKTAYAAMRHGCEKFILISTDKAVNPTNIMGASKRMCEMVIQSLDWMIRQGRTQEIEPLYTHADEDDDTSTMRLPEDVHTQFAAVRFGNVLGSNGSVIPLFRKQIEAGGPVTVTHPDIIRYFMTIPEAVSLVLKAGVAASGGEIFVLDMGEPVKIADLARSLIRLSGFRPDEDIKIEYVGLRPGEKLFEEKLMAEEGLQKTENERIFVGKPVAFDRRAYLERFHWLMAAAYDDVPWLVEMVREIVPTYVPDADQAFTEESQATIIPITLPAGRGGHGSRDTEKKEKKGRETVAVEVPIPTIGGRPKIEIVKPAEPEEEMTAQQDETPKAAEHGPQPSYEQEAPAVEAESDAADAAKEPAADTGAEAESVEESAEGPVIEADSELSAEAEREPEPEPVLELGDASEAPAEEEVPSAAEASEGDENQPEEEKHSDPA